MRARNIKPGFYKNEDLADCPFEARILFIGLWCMADREGRLENRPKRIKAEVFPYDNIDAVPLLSLLRDKGFIAMYGEHDEYIVISNFTKHQNPHHQEVASEIPPPPGSTNKYNHKPITVPQRRRIYARDGHKCVFCGATDRLSVDHIVPVSKGGTSDDDNLRTMCIRCNTSRGNRMKDDDKMMLSQGQDDKHAPCPTDSLIPDSLIPDSLSPAPDGADAATGTEAVEAKDEPPPPKYTDLDMERAERLRAKIDQIEPRYFAGKRKPNLPGWADVFRLIRTVDGRTDEEIEIILARLHEAPFWSGQVRSAEALRGTTSNGQYRFDAVLRDITSPRTIGRTNARTNGFTDSNPEHTAALERAFG